MVTKEHKCIHDKFINILVKEKQKKIKKWFIATEFIPEIKGLSAQQSVAVMVQLIPEIPCGLGEAVPAVAIQACSCIIQAILQ